MLRIIYGNLDTDIDYVFNPDLFFDSFREYDWLDDSLVKEMISDVDESEVLDDNLVRSPVLGLIPVEYLSGGVKTLISIKNNPDIIFNVTGCGEDCSKWLLSLAENQKEDLIINLLYNMDFGAGEFDIEVVNTGKIVHNSHDLHVEACFLSENNVSYKGGVFKNEG